MRENTITEVLEQFVVELPIFTQEFIRTYNYRHVYKEFNF